MFEIADLQYDIGRFIRDINVLRFIFVTIPYLRFTIFNFVHRRITNKKTHLITF